VNNQYKYINIDAAIDAAESTNAVLTNTLKCVSNPALCAAQAITEFVVIGINTVDKIRMNEVIKTQLQSQDYMIKQKFQFEKWAAITEQKIVQNIYKGELEAKRISQKSQLKLMGILRDYYILKTNQYKKENEVQVQRIKKLILTVLLSTVLLTSVYFISKEL